MKKAVDATPNPFLVEARLQRHWTQQVVAERVGTTVVNVSRWERGLSTPGAYFRYHLCTLFGKSAWELGLEVHDGEKSSQCLCQHVRHQEAPASALSPASRLPWHVLSLRNPFFTGREILLEQLHETLRSNAAASLPPVLAISGLGGIGKTQVALEYVYRYRDDYHAIFWVRAETRETLAMDYVKPDRSFHLQYQGERDQDCSIEAVKCWLGLHRHWLLILDNVEEIGLLEEFLPGEVCGHVLLTTQMQATGTLAQRVELPPLDQDEGALFLLRRAKLLRDGTPLEDADRTLRMTAQTVSRLMEGLPLALDQAGAYIEETGCSLSDYLELYQQRCALLLDRRGGTQGNHPQSVRATLSLAFERVASINPAAADLLRLCAFLYPDGIPLRAIAVATADLGPLLQASAMDFYALDNAVATLRTTSLLHRHADTHTLTIHRVVQAVIQDTMDRDTQRLWAERAVRFISDACSDSQRLLQWFNWQHEFPHEAVSASLLTGAALIEHWGMRFKEATRLLYLIGIYLLESGQDLAATDFLQRAQALRKQRGERPFPDVGLVRENYRQFLAATQQSHETRVL